MSLCFVIRFLRRNLDAIYCNNTVLLIGFAQLNIPWVGIERTGWNNVTNEDLKVLGLSAQPSSIVFIGPMVVTRLSVLRLCRALST